MKRTASLATGLRAAALLALLATLGTWVATGAHVGWTQTSRIEFQHDEITGIEYPVRHPTFVAGVELLAAGVGATALFGGLGWLAARRRHVTGATPVGATVRV